MQHDNDSVRFVANVIQTQHSKPARKLRGLARLIEQGHEPRIAQFSIDILMVDGQRFEWADLETVPDADKLL